jgi:RNA polymerase sigma factor (sigma-70 family)
MLNSSSSSSTHGSTKQFVGDTCINDDLFFLVQGARPTSKEEQHALVSQLYAAASEEERRQVIEEITRAAFPMLLHITKRLWRIFPPAWEMADVLQEGTIVLYETLNRMTPGKNINPFSYLYTAIYHRLIDAAKMADMIKLPSRDYTGEHYQFFSLDAPITGGRDNTEYTYDAIEAEYTPPETERQAIRRQAIIDAFHELTTAQQQTMNEHYGLCFPVQEKPTHGERPSENISNKTRLARTYQARAKMRNNHHLQQVVFG